MCVGVILMTSNLCDSPEQYRITKKEDDARDGGDQQVTIDGSDGIALHPWIVGKEPLS
jgi:hypothetical protein